MDRPPLALRIAAGLLFISSGWGLIDLVLHGGGDSSGTLATYVLGVAGVAGGWALWIGRPWGYVLSLIVFATGLVEVAHLFLYDERQFSWTTRLGAGLVALVLSSVPVALMLIRASRRWFRAAIPPASPGQD